MGIASIHGVFRLVIIAATPIFLMSCLITDPIEARTPINHPPSVVSAPMAMHPLDRIIEINRDDMVGDLELEIVVRDPNTDQMLSMQVYVDFVSSISDAFVPQANDNQIIATDTVERSINIRVPINRLGEAGECHRVELLVATGFRSAPDPRQPTVDRDLHQSVWWVALTDETHPTVDMNTCPR